MGSLGQGMTHGCIQRDVPPQRHPRSDWTGLKHLMDLWVSPFIAGPGGFEGSLQLNPLHGSMIHMGLAPAAADWSSIKNNTNNTDRKSKSSFLRDTVSCPGAPRCELGAKQGRSRAIGPLAGQGGKEDRLQTACFLKAYAKVLLFA